MDLEETLEKVVELAREELHIVRSTARRRPRLATAARAITRPKLPLITWITTPTSSTDCTTPSTPVAGGITARAIATEAPSSGKPRSHLRQRSRP